VAETPAPAIDAAEIAEMLERAEERYQHEQYDEALRVATVVLEQDPSNRSAENLKDRAEKAKSLLERIAQEDAAARGADAQTTPTPQIPPGPKVRDVDVWGAKVVTTDSLGLDEMPEVRGPMVPPKASFEERLLPFFLMTKKVLKPLAFVLLGVGLLIGAYYVLRLLSATVVPQHTSLLVLPASAPGTNQVLTQVADGFTDDVIRKLSMVSDLGVVAPASAFAQGVASAPPNLAARMTGAGKVMQWSMSESQSDLVIRCAIVDSSSPKPEWEQQFTFPARELPMQRSEILVAILKALQVRATEEEQVALHKPPTASDVAYSSFLQGRAMTRRMDVYGPRAGIESLKRAIAADSQFADAHAALGWGMIRAYEFGDTAGYHAGVAGENIQSAVEMGFRNSETFKAWGALEMQRKAYGKAAERLEEAVSIAPSDADARRRLAQAYLLLGRLDKAVSSSQTALRDDPVNLDSYILVGQVLQISALLNNDNKEEYEQVVEIFRIGARLASDRSLFLATYVAGPYWYLQQPDNAIEILLDHAARHRDNSVALYLLARVQQAAGKPKQEWQDGLSRARAVLVEQLKENPRRGDLLGWLALVQTRLGEFRDSQQSIGQALTVGANDPSVLYLIARAYSLQRDKKNALEYLRKAIDYRVDLTSLVDLDFFNLHSDPEFLKLLTR
jgi:tetratricopeptide (TPR) repeat protein